MVFLRLTVKVYPREQTQSSGSFFRHLIGERDNNDSAANGAAKKPASFLLVLPDPEEITLGGLAGRIQEKWRKLRPEAEPLEIKKLLDDDHDSEDLDPDLTVADVFVDHGKGAADKLDQRRTVRVIQRPASQAPVRFPSVSLDWDAAAQDYERQAQVKQETMAKMMNLKTIHEDPDLESGSAIDGRISDDDAREVPMSSVEREDAPRSLPRWGTQSSAPGDNQGRTVAPTPERHRMESQELGDWPRPSPTATRGAPRPGSTGVAPQRSEHARKSTDKHAKLDLKSQSQQTANGSVSPLTTRKSASQPLPKLTDPLDTAAAESDDEDEEGSEEDGSGEEVSEEEGSEEGSEEESEEEGSGAEESETESQEDVPMTDAPQTNNDTPAKASATRTPHAEPTADTSTPQRGAESRKRKKSDESLPPNKERRLEPTSIPTSEPHIHATPNGALSPETPRAPHSALRKEAHRAPERRSVSFAEGEDIIAASAPKSTPLSSQQPDSVKSSNGDRKEPEDSRDDTAAAKNGAPPSQSDAEHQPENKDEPTNPDREKRLQELAGIDTQVDRATKRHLGNVVKILKKLRAALNVSINNEYSNRLRNKTRFETSMKNINSLRAELAAAIPSGVDLDESGPEDSAPKKPASKRSSSKGSDSKNSSARSRRRSPGPFADESSEGEWNPIPKQPIWAAVNNTESRYAAAARRAASNSATSTPRSQSESQSQLEPQSQKSQGQPEAPTSAPTSAQGPTRKIRQSTGTTRSQGSDDEFELRPTQSPHRPGAPRPNGSQSQGRGQKSSRDLLNLFSDDEHQEEGQPAQEPEENPTPTPAKNQSQTQSQNQKQNQETQHDEESTDSASETESESESEADSESEEEEEEEEEVAAPPPSKPDPPRRASAPSQPPSSQPAGSQTARQSQPNRLSLKSLIRDQKNEQQARTQSQAAQRTERKNIFSGPSDSESEDESESESESDSDSDSDSSNDGGDIMSSGHVSKLRQARKRN
ncbi:hypothetical protein P168DRAFT_326488 [Aspergillus campestris IBT 28561]|uniref:Nucleolar protein Dnt1-like N-terminal domain-containing protein n=1 Tax=Aspergillus campestris (strain IBT 28561) TaxID=1392248 RepID=A0A2I1D495_ASPC2|nr:uncharacterized protein P168DRAFT_326488 [Aspergillus campestris IBT 28561]PKY04686.1 hypothetical protein P168DRAFT_326488 [Aspergillus campestris IBT 28561]